jgi:hypothetical protein
MVSSAAPERARCPRWMRCQSVMHPLTAEYWHIGAMTMRLANSRAPTRSGVNSVLIPPSPYLFWNLAPPSAWSQWSSSFEVLVAHRPAATLSKAKGKREAPALSANVVCSHNSQTNRSEPAMCVSAISWTQSRKCLCAVTFPHPRHSFTIISSRLSETVARSSRSDRSGQGRVIHHLSPKPKRPAAVAT